jgi:type IV secretion system protein VirB10
MQTMENPPIQGEIADEHIGPPGKFDAEPVRRKSRRWMYVTAGVFLAICATVAVGSMQLKRILAESSAAREEKSNREKGESSIPRPRKVFDAAALPADFGKPKTEITDLPVPMANKPAAATVVPAPGAPTMPVPMAAPPAAKSMMVSDVETTALGGTATPTAMGVTATRPKTVQELAKRAPGPLTSTPQALAAPLGNRSLLLARGAFIPCTLHSQLNSNVPGPVSCITSQNIYSDDGKVLLIEKASRVEGEYKNTLKNGDRRIGILWQRIKTPNGVVIDVDSPTSDAVGTVGVDGDIDNHWWDRIGAAFLLSLVDDAVKLETAKQGAQSSGGTQSFQATTGTTKSIAEKVLDSTINIAPTLTKNRGERLMVLVNRDIWFDDVYELSRK